MAAKHVAGRQLAHLSDRDSGVGARRLLDGSDQDSGFELAGRTIAKMWSKPNCNDRDFEMSMSMSMSLSLSLVRSAKTS